MSDKKNIDRLFQEKFKDFEVAPNDAVWNRISESLPKKKKKRRVIPLWWQVGGIAAAIALLLTVGVSVFNSGGNTNEDLPVVDTDTNDTENNKEVYDLNNSTNPEQNELKKDVEELKYVDSESNKEVIKEEKENNTPKKDNVSNQLTAPNNVESNAVATTEENKKTSTSQKRNTLWTGSDKDSGTKVADNIKTSKSNLEDSNKTELIKDSELKSTIKKNIEDNKTAVTDNASSKKSDSESLKSDSNKTEIEEKQNEIIEDTKKQSLTDAIADSTDPIDEKEDEKQNRWSVAPNVAPVYYSSFGEGSSLDKQFNQNSKSSDVNMSYGITGAYAVSKKLKIRAGINRVDLSQTTSDVYAFTGAETAARGIDAQFTNIKFKEGLPTVSLMSSKMMNRASMPEVFNTKIAGDIDQKFGFIEVPLEIEYSLLDKKIGINVIGGFSTFFLNQNEVYADINGASTLIGEANNLNNTSFSANFGLGMDYNISKQWHINLEPQFKYQINTFNNTTGDFRPFFIGVYTGLSFKF